MGRKALQLYYGHKISALEDRIAELERTINRAGALACQGASQELIRQKLAESGLGQPQRREPES